MVRLLTSATLAASWLLACNGGSTGTTGSGTGTTSGSGTTSGQASTAITSSSSGATYCNGSELVSAGSTNLYVASYPESDDLRSGCDDAFDALSDAGATFTAMGGILDANSYASQPGLLTFFPAGCDDLGESAAPAIAATAITPPSGASTVAAARASQLDGGTVYGIVTYINSPFWDATEGDADAATLYLQDPPGGSTPTPLSGISVFIDKNLISANGTVGYPDSGLARGDVVAISGLEWSTFGATDPQTQLLYTSGSTVTRLGTQPLPAAVLLSATQIANSSAAQYLGMRVIQTDVPDSVQNGCPTLLQSN